jgi:uncharacterized membrane protein
VSEFWFRAPSAILSLGAVALFAWWMRERGRFGLIATTLMGVSAFEAVHGREARMYAELELLGVAIAVLASAWLATSRYWHAPALGVLVFVGLVTHVSMFLLAVGLLALPGRRTDREAWRWRAAIGLGVVAWVVVWGPSFTVQARGGHSSWIPPTTASRLAIAVGHVISFEPALAIAAAIATIAGGVMIWNRDARCSRGGSRVQRCRSRLPRSRAASSRSCSIERSRSWRGRRASRWRASSTHSRRRAACSAWSRSSASSS